jgi:hypothetical protein
VRKIRSGEKQSDEDDLSESERERSVDENIPPKPEKTYKSIFKFGKKQGQKKAIERKDEKVETPITHEDVKRTTTTIIVKKSSLIESEKQQKAKPRHSLLGFLKEKEPSHKVISHFPTNEERYEGPIEEIRKNETELSPIMLRKNVDVYHSGYSTIIHRKYRFFTRERHGGEEDVIERPSYNYDTSEFKGTPEALHQEGEIDTQPLQSICIKYHKGVSYVRRKKHPKRKSLTESSETSSESEEEKASIKIQAVKKRQPKHLVVTEPYVGELSSLKPDNEFDGALLEECVKTCQPSISGEKLGHSAVDENKQKSRSKAKLFLKKAELIDLSAYPSKSEHFEVSEITKRDNDVEKVPINEFSSVYHPGTSYIKTKKVKASEEGDKQRATIYLKDAEQTQKRQIVKENMPLISESYTGPIEELHRSNDVESFPIEESIVDYQALQSTKKAKIYIKPKSKFLSFSKRKDYPISEAYTGQLESLKPDIEHRSSDLTDFVDVIYAQTPLVKILIEQPSDEVDESQGKQTVVLHLQSSEAEVEPEASKKRKIFGFMRRGQAEESVSTSPHPRPDDSVDVMAKDSEHVKSPEVVRPESKLLPFKNPELFKGGLTILKE